MLSFSRPRASKPTFTLVATNEGPHVAELRIQKPRTKLIPAL